MFVDVLRLAGVSRWLLMIVGVTVCAGLALMVVSLSGVGAGDLANLGAAAAPPPLPTLEIDGVTNAPLTSISGLPADLWTNPQWTSLPPPSTKPNNLTLVRKWSNTSDFYDWRKAVLFGRTDRKSVSLIYPNSAGSEIQRVNLYNCWPTKWVGPNLNQTTQPPTEELVISCETMKVEYS